MKNQLTMMIRLMNLTKLLKIKRKMKKSHRKIKLLMILSLRNLKRKINFNKLQIKKALK